MIDLPHWAITVFTMVFVCMAVAAILDCFKLMERRRKHKALTAILRTRDERQQRFNKRR